MRFRKILFYDVVKKQEKVISLVEVFQVFFGFSRLHSIAAVLVVVEIVLVGIVVAALFVWPFMVTKFWEDVRGVTEAEGPRLLVVFVLAVGAFLFYLARVYIRPFYGLAEILIGAAACWAGLGNRSVGALAGSLAVASGVYIMIRGFDNLIDDKPARASAERAVNKAKGSKTEALIESLVGPEPGA